VKLSVPFCEKGGTVKRMTDFLHKKIGTSETCSDVATEKGPNLQADFLLAHPNALHFGTGLRTKKLKNLPPATFSTRFLPSQASSPSYFNCKTKCTYFS